MPSTLRSTCVNKPVVFTTSGTVQADEGTYLKRQADDELLRLCQQGDYAYILTARQMGKSSLMVATSEQLQQQGIQTVIADLQPLGVQTTTADQWYIGVLERIARKLRMMPELMTWWEAHQHLSEVQRLVQFFEDVVLTRIEGQVVIFFDEIDSTLSLGFTDDFFIALRYCYTARAENPAFKRLSFVLLGVATPSELIADSNRTPFNIGTLVELRDFTEAEAMPLAAGLGLPQEMGRHVLRWILQWTGGHPYLTQAACQEVVRQGCPSWTEVAVKQLIYQLFFGERREQDKNLQFVQTHLIGRAPGGDVVEVLRTYREIRCGRGAVYDEDQSLIKAHLKLSGVVKRVGSRLEVRNPIYQRVFDQRWIREQWPETESLLQQLKHFVLLPQVAITSLAALSLTAVIMAGLAWYANDQRVEALAAREAALASEKETSAAREAAVAAREAAEEGERLAAAAATEASEAKDLAEEREKDARASERQADLSRQAESEQRQRAEAGEAEAQVQRQRAERNAEEAGKQRWSALNSELRARTINIQSLATSGLYKQALQNALVLGRDLQNIEHRTEIHPTTWLKSVSILENTYHQQGYFEYNSLRAHERQVTDITFSSDGETFASTGIDGKIKLWDISGRKLKTLEGHDSVVLSISFSPDDQNIVSSDIEGNVKIWNITSGKPQKLTDTQNIKDIRRREAFSRFLDTETIVVVNSFGGEIRLWDIPSGEIKGEYQTEDIIAMAFSRDGKFLATGHFREGIKLWNSFSGERIDLPESISKAPWVQAIEFSPDGRNLAIANNNGVIKIWDISSGRELRTLQSDSAEVIKISYSLDGKTLASLDHSGKIRLWNLEAEPNIIPEKQDLFINNIQENGLSYSILIYPHDIQEVNDFELPDTLALTFSPDGQTLASASFDGTVKLLNTSGREREKLIDHNSEVTGISFSPDGLTLASGSLDGNIKIWDIESKKHQNLLIHNGGITSVNFSPNGKFLASTSLDESAHLWNLSEHQPQALITHEDEAWGIDFSSNNRTLASASKDGIIRFWDIHGQEIKSVKGHHEAISSLSFSPNGQILASASFDKTVKLWSVSGQNIKTLRGHSEEVLGIDFSPDGRRLASASADRTINLWDVSGKKTKKTLSGHTNSVASVSFAPDGQTLASASFDGTVRLWDVSGQEIQTFIGHNSPVTTVSFSPDGQTLASADADGVIILWDLNLNSLVNKICWWWRDYLTYGNATDEEKALCPHITALQPLPSTRFGPSQWFAHLQATWHAALNP